MHTAVPCEVFFALATAALATAARAVVNDAFAFAAVVPVAQPTAAFALAAAAATQTHRRRLRRHPLLRRLTAAPAGQVAAVELGRCHFNPEQQKKKAHTWQTLATGVRARQS